MYSAKRFRVLACVGTAGLIGGFVALVGGGAGAASARSTTPARPAAATATGKGAIAAAVSSEISTAPKGYTIVNSGELSNPAESESDGQATCPAGTVVWGGGVTDSGGLEETINSSWPINTTSWYVYIENSSTTTDDTFVVYAVCAKKPSKYVIDSSSTDSPAGGSVTNNDVGCPAKTVELGGGAYSNDAGADFTIHSMVPYANEWYSWMNNSSSGADDTVNVYAICGHKPAKYTVEESAPTDNPAGSNTEVVEECPTNTSVLSAGLETTSLETDVSLNEINADDGAAYGFEANNSGSDDQSISAFAVCAK